MPSQNVVQQFLDAFAVGDFEKTGQFFADDALYVPEPHNRLTKTEFAAALGSIHTAIPDVIYQFEDWRANGDTVIVRVGGSGTHTGVFAFPVPGYPVVQPTGNAITLPAFDWTFVVVGDRVVELHFATTEDSGIAPILRQMGVEM